MRRSVRNDWVSTIMGFRARVRMNDLATASRLKEVAREAGVEGRKILKDYPYKLCH